MRKLVGAIILFGFMILYIGGVIAIAARMGQAHWLLQLAFYSVAGIIWAIPLKPLMRWMHAKDKPLPSSEI